MKAVLRGDWLDGREIEDTGVEELRVLKPGLLPPEAPVFLQPGGHGMPPELLMTYTRTDVVDEHGRAVYIAIHT